MIKINEIQQGDYIVVNYEDSSCRGEVTRVNRDDKQACVNNGTQEFWYEENQLSALPITDQELTHLKFHKTQNPDGSVKYMKGAFRLLIPKPDDFSRMEIWYREETRHITQPIFIHQLQNHFHDMTKVHLNEAVFD